MSHRALLLALPLTLAAVSPPLSPHAIDALAAPKSAKAPGCAVGVVEGGALVFARGYGLADLETGRAITPDTSFNIASMTKQFTAAAIGLLIEEGKLSESDDIRRFLPEMRDYGTPIRIANLLNHSSGLRNHMALAAFQPGTHLPSHAEALALVFRQQALNFAPGSRHQYESPNYVLLAEIVERVSGMPFDRFIASRLLAPLEMSASGSNTKSLARAYQGKPDGSFVLNEKVNGARGSSGLQSSVRDFAKWMANYDSPRVGGAAFQARMLSTSTLSDGTPISYRYGLAKEADFGGVPGLLRISHGGQTAAYRSAFSWFPGKGFGTVVMCNHTADARAIETPIIDAWMKGQPAAPAKAEAAEVALDAATASALAGLYYSAADDDIREFVVDKGKLAFRYYGEAYPLAHRGGGRFDFFDQGPMMFERGDGERVILRERLTGQAPLTFERLPPPPSLNLDEFVGRYRSDEVDGEVVLSRDGDRLLVRHPSGEARVAAIAVDRFSGQQDDIVHLAFDRNAAGKVSGLSLSVTSGFSRLRFRRVG